MFLQLSDTNLEQAKNYFQNQLIELRELCKNADGDYIKQ
jgi:hypothetical protein